MNRWDIINFLIEKNNYRSYLEIGYYKGWSFDRVKCQNKWAVDPNPCKTPDQEAWSYGVTGQLNKMTSDDYFSRLYSEATYDIIFIDGLHEATQVKKDITNSLDHLSPRGTIVLHDCNPPKYEHTTTGIDGCWTGDAYKAWVQFIFNYPEYETYTVDTDWGCGIIHTPPREGTFVDGLFQGEDVKEAIKDWAYFERNRKALLDLISVEEFLNKTNERTKDCNSTA